MNMQDKPLKQSVTVWGTIIAGIGAVIIPIGSAMQGLITWADALPKIMTAIGIVVAAIGARRAIGRS